MRRAAGGLDTLPAVTTAEAVRQLSRIGRTDIVHAHMSAAELAAVLTVPCHRARVVATRHFATSRGSGLARVALYPVGVALAEQIAISQFVASHVDSTVVLPNGVESADPGPSTRRRAILVMQRLEEEKRTDIALKAWLLSTLRHYGWRLLIAGRGSKRAELKQLCSQLGLGDSVSWLGFVDDPERLLSEVAILLAPAPAEPFGMVVVEAMARATPVIAAAGGAHPETLGNSGWLFPVGDAQACAQLLDRAATEDLSSYGDRLRHWQQNSFEIEAHTDRLLDIYRRLSS